MEDLIQTIKVTDGSGDELTLYEYQQFIPRLSILGLRRKDGKKRLELETGEPVRRIDDGNFEIIATGEQLSRSV